MTTYDAERLLDEIDRLNEQCAFKSVELHARDRVIARLLDGYEPHPTKQGWWRPGSPERPEMSDGEAAIIRNHQDKS